MDFKQNGNGTNNTTNNGADKNAYVFVPKKGYSINNFLASMKNHKMTENPEDEEKESFYNKEPKPESVEEYSAPEQEVNSEPEEDRTAAARRMFEGKVWIVKRKPEEIEEQPEQEEQQEPESVEEDNFAQPEPEADNQEYEDIDEEDLDAYLDKLVAQTGDEGVDSKGYIVYPNDKSQLVEGTQYTKDYTFIAKEAE